MINPGRIEAATHSVLRVNDLHAGYGRIPIVNGVSFSLEAGQVIGVSGQNGMGKTTMLRALVGQITASAGTIHLAGCDITHAPAHRRARSGLGYVPQGREIFPGLTTLENLQIGAAGQGKQARAVVSETLDDFPALKPLLNRLGANLSGGEQQLLAIARCLCARPSVMLLDEPSEGIAPSLLERLADILLRLKSTRRFSMLLVEQNCALLAAVADSTVVLHNGAISMHQDFAR